MASQKNTHIHTGRQGESMAVAYLQDLGYNVLQQNYRYKRAEIDIIAQQGSSLVFVEVKTRGSNVYGYPEEAVNYRKEALLLTAATAYIEEHNWQFDVRFDIISVTLSAPPVIHHIQDAFH